MAIKSKVKKESIKKNSFVPQNKVSLKALDLFLKKVSVLERSHEETIKSILKEIEHDKLQKVRRKIATI